MDKKNRLGFKTYFGTAFLGTTSTLCSTLMTSLFMLYLTDYSGLGAVAAALGSSILVATRLFDAVNDPLQGWVMDRSKPGRFGKYKPFIMLSILLSTVGIIGLFALPTGFAKTPALAAVWIVVFYLVYDFGASFHVPNVLYRTITLDVMERSKLMVAPRFLAMFIGVVGAMFIMIVQSVDAGINNMHTSFGITVTVAVLIAGALSFAGIACIKERHIVTNEKNSEKVNLKDIIALITQNKALRVRVLSMLFDGFVWTFLFSAATYYVKWAYCADMTTGAVDSEKFGMMSMVSTMLSILPLLVGTLIALPLMKKVGSPNKLYRTLVFMQMLGCGALYVCQLLGLLEMSPVVYFVLVAIPAFCVGTSFVPGEAVSIECMDYEIYLNGKDKSALCNAAVIFIGKVQSAVATASIGIVLTAVGYIVDSETDTFLGSLESIPTMLDGFVLLMGLIPCICALISWLIWRGYPIDNNVRKDMQAKLDARTGEN